LKKKEEEKKKKKKKKKKKRVDCKYVTNINRKRIETCRGQR
jgi:hypothetical protein